jgi:hypothetical protein
VVGRPHRRLPERPPRRVCFPLCRFSSSGLPRAGLVPVPLRLGRERHDFAGPDHAARCPVGLCLGPFSRPTGLTDRARPAPSPGAAPFDERNPVDLPGRALHVPRSAVRRALDQFPDRHRPGADVLRSPLPHCGRQVGVRGHRPGHTRHGGHARSLRALPVPTRGAPVSRTGNTGRSSSSPTTRSLFRSTRTTNSAESACPPPWLRRPWLSPLRPW